MTGEVRQAKSGGVIWICGLSGVGKTTLAMEVVRLMANVHENVARIDGDEFRRSFMPEAGYAREDRVVVARAISQHAWTHAQCGSLCVVSTISLFAEIHDGNRACERAFQLPLVQSLLRAPVALLHARRAALMHHANNVVGTDIKADFPSAPDHTFVNDGNVEILLAEAITIRALWLARQQFSENGAT